MLTRLRCRSSGTWHRTEPCWAQAWETGLIKFRVCLVLFLFYLVGSCPAISPRCWMATVAWARSADPAMSCSCCTFSERLFSRSQVCSSPRGTILLSTFISDRVPQRHCRPALLFGTGELPVRKWDLVINKVDVDYKAASTLLWLTAYLPWSSLPEEWFKMDI